MLNANVDEGSNEDASKSESEESDHQNLDDDLQNEDQVELGSNFLESDNDEDNDYFNEKNDYEILQEAMDHGLKMSG